MGARSGGGLLTPRGFPLRSVSLQPYHAPLFSLASCPVAVWPCKLALFVHVRAAPLASLTQLGKIVACKSCSCLRCSSCTKFRFQLRAVHRLPKKLVGRRQTSSTGSKLHLKSTGGTSRRCGVRKRGFWSLSFPLRSPGEKRVPILGLSFYGGRRNSIHAIRF